MLAKELTTLRLLRSAALPPHAEPVSAGIPLARGLLQEPAALAVMHADGRPLPSQAAATARWSDGSVRWALVDFVMPAGDRREERVTICVCDEAQRPAAQIAVAEHGTAYRVDTGAVRIEVSRDLCAPLTALHWTGPGPGLLALVDVRLEDVARRQFAARLEQLDIEASGPVRLTFAGSGAMVGKRGQALCRFALRLSVFLATALVRLDLTVHNPRRARHRGGLWDLGDPGSILLRSLTVAVCAQSPPGELRWRLAPGDTEQRCASGTVEIYQASSGGEHWASRAHRDRSGQVRLPFRGCRVSAGEHVARVDRASPTLSRIADGLRLSVARPRFWQEFPSALEGAPDALRIGLFPAQAVAPFELQGGEQKTFTVFLCIGRDTEADLAWVHDPLTPSLPPEYVAASAAFPHLVPADADPHADYRHLVGEAIEGPRSFFAKREVVDEYGWRHFGDTWADHEETYFAGERPVISHYNNQYDLVYGFLLHFARSGDPRWFELAAALARHVIDIDLYRTDADRPAYNGGQFWHTAHYDDAGRATHRSYSADSAPGRDRRRYGGGPSCEHVYTTGLLYFYYLTGNPAARAAVVQLADWVQGMDDGARSVLGCVDPGATGLASYTRTFDYHGPGRGAGNSITALIDAHRLTAAPQYLAKAEELIARCIHPRDEPGRHGLEDAETRWSYTVFLQALGIYLDVKCELGQHDHAFAYARASLVRYARWMLAHEAPFATRFDRLEYPTESWPAQDVRKSCVFDYAAQYGPPELRAELTAQAEYFFAQSLHGVLAFETHACTRPLAVLLANGVQRAGFRLYPPPDLAPDPPGLDFGAPSGFRSQQDRVRARLTTAAGWLALARALLRPTLWHRLATGRIR